MAARKPKISYKSFILLKQLDDYIREYDLRGAALIHAAPDTFDGAISFGDIEELHRRRWLRISSSDGRMRAQDCHEYSCGDLWTVELTLNAIKRFWPDRLTVAPLQIEVV